MFETILKAVTFADDTTLVYASLNFESLIKDRNVGLTVSNGLKWKTLTT